MGFVRFVLRSAGLVLRGGPAYYTWVLSLLALIVWGAFGYFEQFQHGMIVTGLRDHTSWGFYIGNFTFLVGVAAAAVMLVIPAYIYQWKPIKEVAILGELLAISAVVMCLLFVTADLGRPDRFWHLLPGIGVLNFPSSLLAWDTLVLNGYLVLNIVIVGHLLHSAYVGRSYNKRIVGPLVLFSIPLAVSIHTVIAFIYIGMPARPFWNASILAPRFLCSAFCSGPAILIILFQVLRRTTHIKIQDAAIWKVAELMAYAMFLNLFLLGSEVFKEYYSGTEHLVHMQYLFTGVKGAESLVFFAWTSVVCSVVAFILFLIPATRKNLFTLNLGCLLIYAGVYIEKGVGLVIPGFNPSMTGEIYEYVPTVTEIRIGAGIFSVGFLVFTILCKVAAPIMTGEFTAVTVQDTSEKEEPEP